MRVQPSELEMSRQLNGSGYNHAKLKEPREIMSRGNLKQNNAAVLAVIICPYTSSSNLHSLVIFVPHFHNCFKPLRPFSGFSSLYL